MHVQRRTILLLSACGGGLAVFLPWEKVYGSSEVSFYAFGLFALVGLLALQGNREQCIPRTHSIIAVLALLLMTWLDEHTIVLCNEPGTPSAGGFYAQAVLAVLTLGLLALLRKKCQPK